MVQRRIKYDLFQILKQIVGLNLPIPMNAEQEWELNKTHVRVALRNVVSLFALVVLRNMESFLPIGCSRKCGKFCLYRLFSRIW